MLRNKYFVLIISLLIFSCSVEDEKTAKHHDSRDNVILVSDKIESVNFSLEDLGMPMINILGDYLILTNAQTIDKGIHLFNKNTFEYITSVGTTGQGVGEISRYGFVTVNEETNSIYVNDYGKNLVHQFELDSVISNEKYLPKVAFKFDKGFTPLIYEFLNDSLILGEAGVVVDNSSFKTVVSNFNIKKNEIGKSGYKHPDVDSKNILSSFDLSKDKKIYVQGQTKYDLLSICTADSELKFNIYGPDWEDSKGKKDYYRGVSITGDKIIASFLGDKAMKFNDQKRPVAVYPTKLLVFDLEGNYKATLETKHQITKFEVDTENNRLFLALEGTKNPVAYIDLNGLNI